MKLIYSLIFSFALTSTLFGQSVCDQFLAASRNKNQELTVKRSFLLSTSTNGQKSRSFTEMDTLGRMHFWGDVGSLQIESYYADGKRYAKIQDGYITNDDWTWKEVPGNDYNRVKWYDAFKMDMQNINCQEVGTQNVKSKNTALRGYL